MGGYGSGRWRRHDKRDAVEECWVLDVNQLARDGLLVRGYRAGTLTWTQTGTGEPVASVRFVVEPVGVDGVVLRLEYQAGRGEHKRAVVEPIGLTTTRPTWGGVRWWFSCPLVSGGTPCRRRVAKLYLAPGGAYFGCRTCYDLSDESCQESHKDERLFAKLAQDTGFPPEIIRDVLRRRR